MMSHKIKALLLVLFFGGLLLAAGLYVHNTDIAILDPAGTIAAEQRNLLVFATGLSMLVVLPVFVLTAVIAWKYRESNKKATYRPEWDGSAKAEAVWWGIPIVIILILSVATWQSTHKLDPYRPLDSNAKPLVVQVIALQWKWLFVYPEQNIASVNALQIPVDRPIEFRITSDAPMNSFWIPRLGGQVYAMSGMQTKLHLMATEIGTFQGSSANLSGSGFADMTFSVKATTQSAFDDWVTWVQRYSQPLNHSDYLVLAEPSDKQAVMYFAPVEDGLYTTVLDSYMAHMPHETQTQTMNSSEGDHE